MHWLQGLDLILLLYNDRSLLFQVKEGAFPRLGLHLSHVFPIRVWLFLSRCHSVVPGATNWRVSAKLLDFKWSK